MKVIALNIIVGALIIGFVVLPNDPIIRVDLLSGEKSGPAEPAGS
jgi:hypothetical protein